MASLPSQPDPAVVSMEKVWETHPQLVTEKASSRGRTERRDVPWEQLWGTSNSIYGNGLEPTTHDVSTNSGQQVMGIGWHTTNEEYGKGVGTAAPARPVLNRQAAPQACETSAEQHEDRTQRSQRPNTNLPGRTALWTNEPQAEETQQHTEKICLEAYPPADYSNAEVGNLMLRTGPLPTPARQYMEEYCDRLMKTSLRT